MLLTGKRIDPLPGRSCYEGAGDAGNGQHPRSKIHNSNEENHMVRLDFYCVLVTVGTADFSHGTVEFGVT